MLRALTRRSSGGCLASVVVACLLGPAAQAGDWPRFRGPNGSGVAGDDAATPVQFGPDRNLAWKVKLPGDGVSSPIVVGDRVIVTTYSGYGAGGGNQLDLVRHLVCLDRRTGATLWSRPIEAVLPEDPYTGMGVPSHGYASHTPASDGRRIYAFFGKSGVHAFDLDGTPLWQRSVGTDSDPRRWGSASSPIVVGDVVVVTAGPERRAIVGLDTTTGEERWSAPADSLGSVWGTPATAVIDKTRTDVVIGAPGEFWGLNPATGKIRWYSAGVGDDGFNTSVVVAEGIAYAIEGRSGGSVAVRAGGKGDVAATNTLWSGRDANRFGTPVVYGGRIYVVSNGVMSCLDATTGTRLYQSRLGGGEGGGGRRGGSDYSSPVAADGKIYYVTGRGEVHVSAAGDTFESLAVNHVGEEGESFAATPAIADGAIFIRSNRHLACFRQAGD
ncbi:MAG: PQQ-binding-like beta-propeller repeat protein [Planctomycetaceae bacterium]